MSMCYFCCQVYLGVMWHGGKVGVAYYDLDSTRAYIMLDTMETDDFKLLLRGKCGLQLIICFARSDMHDKLSCCVKSDSMMMN